LPASALELRSPLRVEDELTAFGRSLELRDWGEKYKRRLQRA
jgi:hypothetical protein